MATKQLHPKLIEESAKTIQDAIDKLEEHGKVFVCRPTGFGKTYMLSRIAKYYREKYPEKDIAYIYPLDIIKDAVLEDYGTEKESDLAVRDAIAKHTKFYSYQTLTRRFTSYGPDYWEDEFEQYSIVLLDEVHGAGSEGFKKIYDSIKHKVNKDGIRLVGVTATPNRMDDTVDFNVLDNIFDGIKVYDYTLNECIEDGILKPFVIACRRYDTIKLAKDLGNNIKQRYKEKKIDFDENAFNVELGRIIKSTGTEAELIYKYLPRAGYNLTDPNQKYFKFIVFFTNIEDVAKRGPEVEEWFSEAFNEVAKRELGLKKEFIIRSIYLTSSDTKDGKISSLVEEHGKNRLFFKRTDKLAQIENEKYMVDLILTVNMTNMGYHDKNVSGIMMMRGTRSEVIFFQQLGRTISVTSEYNPLIYDLVSNSSTKHWTKKDRQREIIGKIMGSVDPTDPDDKKNYDDYIANFNGDFDNFDNFIKNYEDTSYPDKLKFRYLYEDRNAPIVAISADTGASCKYIAEKLIECGVKLRPEDAMYNHKAKVISSSLRTKDEKEEAMAIIKCINDKQASDFYEQNKGTTQTLYNHVQKLIGGKK